MTLAEHLRNDALDHARQGHYVFPLKRQSKEPLISGWQIAATTEQGRINRWWNGKHEYNIGIACGPSNLVVIDLDAPKEAGQRFGGEVLWELMCRDDVDRQALETYTVSTPNGGYHLYYRASEAFPLGNSVGQIGQNIDIRARGGFVVAAGSMLYAPYIVHKDLPIRELPDDLLVMMNRQVVEHRRRREEAMRPSVRPAPVSNIVIPPVAVKYLAKAIQTLADAPVGTRNATLVSVAYSLGRRCPAVFDRDLVADQLRVVCARKDETEGDFPPSEYEPRIQGALSRGMSNPAPMFVIPDSGISA